jgi:nitroimidazol reductase NimA-like FMN-containing flavoprotein (pyridoxamine 5'-phosphate oxidase superfamily)
MATPDLAAARRMFGSLPTVAVASLGPDGAPHVVPLWFVWPEDAVYVSVRRDGRTWANAGADPRVALTVDLGRSWVELAGIEIVGSAECLPAEHARMRAPISAWHEKYRPLLSGDGFARLTGAIRALGFLRVVPEAITGWDHARGD